jgi:hypothetical protein
VSGAAAPAVRPGRSSAPARPLAVPPRPRRVSGPDRRRPAERSGQRSDQHQGIALGLIAAVERLSPRRLPGGRTWIALVAFALIGIVTMQLGLLKLNGGIGRALEHEALLQRENTGLSIENSELAASGRITSEAVKMGMESVPAGAVRFLQVRPRLDARLGAQALTTPIDGTAAGSGEAAGSSTTTSPAESSGASSTEAGASTQAGEPSTTGSTSTPAPSEPSATESASTPASGEAGASRGTEEPSRGTGESASGAASGASSTTAGAGSGSAEGAPAGGTRAGSSG